MNHLCDGSSHAESDRCSNCEQYRTASLRIAIFPCMPEGLSSLSSRSSETHLQLSLSLSAVSEYRKTMDVHSGRTAFRTRGASLTDMTAPTWHLFEIHSYPYTRVNGKTIQLLCQCKKNVPTQACRLSIRAACRSVKKKGLGELLMTSKSGDRKNLLPGVTVRPANMRENAQYPVGRSINIVSIEKVCCRRSATAFTPSVSVA